MQKRKYTYDVTVGVPLHNCEAYIGECLESLKLQAQGAYQVEILIIDDASTDGSAEVVERFKRANSEVAITLMKHKSNSGLWKVRNEIYALAQGEYILCVDADDYLSPTAIGELLQVVHKSDADIVVFPFINVFGDKKKEMPIAGDDKFDLNSMPLDTYHFSVCNKLIRTSLITDNNLRVPDGLNCWEDLSVASRLLALTDKVTTCKTAQYFYRRHNAGSYTSQNHKTILEQHLACADFLVDRFTAAGLAEKYADFLSNLKFVAKIKMLRGNRFEYRRWLNTYSETHRRIFSVPGINFCYKALFKIISFGKVVVR